MKNLRLLIALLLAAAIPELCVASIDAVGFVKSMDGEVLIVNGEKTLQAARNMEFDRGDSIRTGTGGRVGLMFQDGTVVSLGPDSEIAVEEFLFDPAAQKLSFVVRMLKGTFSFITGQIAKLAPEKVRLETPEATLGVRGTKFAVAVD